MIKPPSPAAAAINYCPVCGTMLRPLVLALEFQAGSPSAAPVPGATEPGSRARITPELVAHVRAWRAAGLSPTQMAKLHGVPRARCSTILYTQKWKDFVLPADAGSAEAKTRSKLSGKRAPAKQA